ncbi:glycyl-radical enzyme activating protein [Spirochaetia bacterium]|nr:glycyl-radical enzyme activating protein [Spirochaetia bacterium]
MPDTKTETACIFDLQRMSIHDGPGIRTNVFFKGCNLRCFWCHNPESWHFEPDIQYFRVKCIGCGACVSACPEGLHSADEQHGHLFNHDGCIACGACAAVCPAGSLVLTGRMMTVDEVFSVVKRDMLFYRKSGGGVTLSGGEPLLQYQFAVKLMQRLHDEGINTAVESALCLPLENIEAAAAETDFFLVDMKIADGNHHKKVTGVSNEPILENLQWLDRSGANYCLRIPLIPGVNDDEDVMGKIAQFAGTLNNVQYIEFMPYHQLGEGKYTSLGMESKTSGLKAPSKERMACLAALFKSGVEVRF